MGDYSDQERQQFQKRARDRLIKRRGFVHVGDKIVAPEKKPRARYKRPVPYEESQRYRCVYRGVQSGKTLCAGCGGKREVGVYPCGFYDSGCTVERTSEERALRDHICSICPSRLAPTDSIEPPPELVSTDLARLLEMCRGRWDWSVGITVARKRSVRHTIHSLLYSGWQGYHLFMEPDGESYYEDACASIHHNAEQLGAFGNSIQALTYMVETDPYADAYMLVQDDVIFSGKGLRKWLEDTMWPREVGDKKLGVVSLYTSAAYKEPAATWAARLGWQWGACCFVFPPDKLKDFLASAEVKHWRKMHGIDGCVGTWLYATRQCCYYPNPSLVQHIGDDSVVWSDKKRATGSRRASEFTGFNTVDFSKLRLGATMPYLPGVTLITPTGDRPESFRLTEQWIARQTYTGPLQWIVVDDGQVPTDMHAKQDYKRREPDGDRARSINNNLILAMDNIKYDKVLIIEDDDWYSPDYIKLMVEALEHGDIAAEMIGHYYNLETDSWMIWDCGTAASLCRTGFTKKAYGAFLDACERGHDTHPFAVDTEFWLTWTGTKAMIRQGERLTVSLKGVPGRRGYTWDRDRPWQPDDEGNKMLVAWLGEDDARDYLAMTKAHEGVGKIIVYTVAQGNQQVAKPLAVSNGDQYFLFTDQPRQAPPWEQVTFEGSLDMARCLLHQNFTTADWTIYHDADLQLKLSPSDLISTIAKQHGRADIYVGEFDKSKNGRHDLLVRRRDAGVNEWCNRMFSGQDPSKAPVKIATFAGDEYAGTNT